MKISAATIWSGPATWSTARPGWLATGDIVTALRALIYLACAPASGRRLPAEFLDRRRPLLERHPTRRSFVSDHAGVALAQAGRAQGFRSVSDGVRAARYLVTHGPPTPQERWEENAGYSPSTLAPISPASFAPLPLRINVATNPPTALSSTDYADFLESHIEAWTVTTQGSLVPGISRHYVRINPRNLTNPDSRRGT